MTAEPDTAAAADQDDETATALQAALDASAAQRKRAEKANRAAAASDREVRRALEAFCRRHRINLIRVPPKGRS